MVFRYQDVYMNLLKRLGWSRMAALTEDGYKHTEYITGLETLLKKNEMLLILNKKFPSTATAVEIRQVLIDLNSVRSKIIMADIQDHVAQIVMCEAYKLKVRF